MIQNDLDVNHLNNSQKQLAQLIISTAKSLQQSEVYCGGCRAFYTPEEWIKRDELYGTNSMLIVCHDGGDMAKFFNYAYECVNYMEQMRLALKNNGYYAESCTCWYTAIFKGI